MSGEKDSRLLMGSPSASIAEKWFILSEGRSLTGRVSGTTSLPLLDSRTDKRGYDLPRTEMNIGKSFAVTADLY
jgi:hypothetical protein